MKIIDRPIYYLVLSLASTGIMLDETEYYSLSNFLSELGGLLNIIMLILATITGKLMPKMYAR